MNQNPTSACSPEVVSDCARMLVGAYRRNDAEDPALFIRAAATVLSAYPEKIVRRVTHPAYGIPSRLKFLPSIAEIREACEEAMKPIYAAEREEKLKAERALRLPPPVVTAEQRERATRRWFDEIRPSMIPAARQTETREQAAEKLMGIAGMSAEDFAKIPDAKPRTTFQPLKEPAQ
jgi:hypothetical protein